VGAGFVCQGNVTNPKAIKDETSNRMLICLLCNNVTKILMKKYNLRLRINGFDVWLASYPSTFFPTLKIVRK
jgi:hypothetical protein